MQTNRSTAGALIGGAVLITFGLLSLVGQVFPGFNWGFLWPIMIIGIGALFFVAMFAGGKQTAAFAIPGSIVSGIGLVFLIQNISHHWESMFYFWTLIILFVGTGIYLMGWYSGDANQKNSGLRVMKVGFILFLIFGAFFEMIFSQFNNILVPVVLIIVGVYLVVTRSNLLHGRKHADSSEPLPPTN